MGPIRTDTWCNPERDRVERGDVMLMWGDPRHPREDASRRAGSTARRSRHAHLGARGTGRLVDQAVAVVSCAECRAGSEAWAELDQLLEAAVLRMHRTSCAAPRSRKDASQVVSLGMRDTRGNCC